MSNHEVEETFFWATSTDLDDPNYVQDGIDDGIEESIAHLAALAEKLGLCCETVTYRIIENESKSAKNNS